MDNCECLSAQINKKSKILILGSMPGSRSLEQQQYYAHSQNRFWKLMGLLFDCNNLPALEYKEKLKILLDNHFALWDVIKCCKREGSLDSNIQNEIPNDFSELLKNYPNIKTICFNGNKAYAAFKKYFPNLLLKYQCHKLPSTSPANAKYKLGDLYNEWKYIKSSFFII